MAIPENLKIRVYNAMIKQILLYASETWTLNSCLERCIETFERKILRTITVILDNIENDLQRIAYGNWSINIS